MLQRIISNPGQAKTAGVWLLGSSVLNFGIAYLMWGERGVQNRVRHMQCASITSHFSQAYIKQMILPEGK